MAGNGRFLQKNATFVEVSLSDGSVLAGKLFMPPQGRVIDLLNDDRAFLPFEAMDGTTFALAKADIRNVKLPTMAAPVYRGSDPYTILDISHTATAEEAKQAYRTLCFANHPDRVRGLGLGGDFVELATQNMMRINNAYAHLLQTFRAAEAGAADHARADGARKKAS